MPNQILNQTGAAVTNTALQHQQIEQAIQDQGERDVAEEAEKASAKKEKEAEEIKKKEEEKKDQAEAKTEEKIEKIAEIIDELKEVQDKPLKEDKSKDVEIGKIKETEDKKEDEKKITIKNYGFLDEKGLIKNPFFKSAIPESYYFINEKNEIDVGSTIPLKGGVSMVGQDLNYGFNLVFNKINKSGGIGDLKAPIRFSSLNDFNKVTRSEKNLEELSKKSPIFIGCFGLDSTNAVIKKIEEKEYFSIFPTNGSKKIRSKENRHISFLRASMQVEISALISYAIKKQHVKKFGIFYEDSLFGEEGLLICQEVLKEFGLKAQARASYPKNTVNIMSAVKKIASEKPNVVICIAQARPAYNFIQQLVNQGLSNCLFLGLGEIFPVQSIIKRSRGIRLALSSVVPNPYNSELEIVKQYRKDMAKFMANRELSTFSLEGYISASIFSQILKSLGKEIFLGNFIKSLESLKNIDFGGLSLDFEPETRTLLNKVWINTGVENAWSEFTLKKT